MNLEFLLIEFLCLKISVMTIYKPTAIVVVNVGHDNFIYNISTAKHMPIQGVQWAHFNVEMEQKSAVCVIKHNK